MCVWSSLTCSAQHEVAAHFAEFGPVESVKLLNDSNGKFNGRCYVNFLNQHDAQAALSMDEGKFQGRTIHVRPSASRAQNGRKGGRNGSVKEKSSTNKELHSSKESVDSV